VNVGDTVAPDDEVCLIEVMKLFTPQYAGVKGVVREILANDSSLVEFDQPLFLVELRD
jgi:acetyl-CoA carboxylase biotin carboxyl carrier protein